MPKFDTDRLSSAPARRGSPLLLAVRRRLPGHPAVACPSHQSRAVSTMSTLLLVSGEPAPSSLRGPSNPATRRGQTLKGALERAGYEVVQAEDAASALARLGEGPPDLVVLAGTVPDMELLEFCALLRRDPAAEKIPFVLVAEAGGSNGARGHAGGRGSRVPGHGRPDRDRRPAAPAVLRSRRPASATHRAGAARRAACPGRPASRGALAPRPVGDAHATHSARTMSVQRALAWSPRRFRCASSSATAASGSTPAMRSRSSPRREAAHAWSGPRSQRASGTESPRFRRDTILDGR